MFLKNWVPKAYSRLESGAAPDNHSPQPPGPDSPPGTNPGCTRCPFAVCKPAYSFLMVAICGAVRHESLSSPRQSNAAGSNVHVVGSVTTPSFTPSRASHAAYLEAGTNADRSAVATRFETKSAAVRVKDAAGAPAMMPS